MASKIEFRDPPEGYELVWDCNAIDGDMYPVKSGWAKVDYPGRYFAVLARPKKEGLVELLDTMQDCVSSVSQWDRDKYDAAEGELRARLAAIEREPLDVEAVAWKLEYAPNLTLFGAKSAIKAAREIGQGGEK